MFFRLRGNNVQLVKSVAQPDGKAKNVGAGSINLVTGKENLNEEVKLKSGASVAVISRLLAP